MPCKARRSAGIRIANATAFTSDAPSAVRNLQYSAAEDPVQGESGFKAAAAIAPVDEMVGPAPVAEDDTPQQPVSVEATPGRNEPCHCGSGKKYKHCHGR